MTAQTNPLEAALSGEQPLLDLPLDHRRVLGRLAEHSSALPFTIAPTSARKLVSLAEQECVSLSSVYLAAYAILLSRYANTQELNIGSFSLDGRSPRPADAPRVNIVHADCAPDLGFPEFLHTVAASAEADKRHPLQEATQASCVSCHSGFSWRNTQAAAGAAWQMRTTPMIHEGTDLSLQGCSYSDGIELAFLYRSDLFEPETIGRMSRHLARLLEEIANKPACSLSEFDMLPPDERALILGLYAGSRAEFPQACLHELFSEQAALRPDAEALVFGGERLTYRQLDECSNQIAQFLIGEGICPEDRVGIFMDRSADMIVSMLGILKAGGAYVPIDPDYPAERLRFIAEDTAVRLVLTQLCVNTILPASAPSICVDALDSPIRKCSREPVMNRSTPESIAVAIYTSGSTGEPKAACIPHRAAVRTVRNTNYIQVVPEDRVAQAGSPSFDAAITEIWLALVNGATLVGVPRDTLLGAVELTRLLRAEHISILVLNTSYVHQIARDTPEVLKSVRKVLFGGEAAEPGPLRELLKHVGPSVLINGYGPAEGCVITTYHEITYIPEDAATVPIGRPVSNAQVYLLDQHQRLAPIGVQGEIYIGGEGVARGYLNRPELTAQRFVPDNFGEKPGGFLYRTGDLARMHGNGEIEFRGRSDEQVKIRGHRIELAEVRQALAAHPEVKQVFLLVREDQAGDKRLTAYVTLRRPLPAAQDSLRRHAKDKLPPHMLPAAYVVMDSIPLNTNGKVDRQALPAPGDRPNLSHGYQAPQNDLERKLTRIWRELLKLDHIGVNDNFFDLGGHSLLAARLIARIEKETGDNIPVATLFEAPTIAQLSIRLSQHTYASAWSPLVRLSAAENYTTAPPFFCVHSLGANLVSYRKIAALMRRDRTVYGLQPHGLDGSQEPLESIEAMASAYIEEIRKKQPHGPYYVGGVCIGGVLAYEIAQQLRAADEDVALVVLIDSFLPGQLQYLQSRPSLTEYLDWHLGEMLLLPLMARFKYLAVWLGNGGIRLRHALGWTEHSALARATKKVAEAHRRAMLAYKPNPYDGKMVQLMCGEASHRAYEDRRLAWSSLAPEGFEVRIVPGNHLTMVEDPHVRVLAQELQSCLDRASNAGSSSHTRDMLGSRANIQDIKARRAGHLAYRFSRPLVSRQFSDRAASRVR
jgi:amino acid adenylation domain-containing protein